MNIFYKKFIINSSAFLFIEILIGFILAYVTITFFFSGARHFENLALGIETANYQARDKNNNLIHIEKISEKEEEELLSAWFKRGGKNVIFILGNSQTHSINQIKAGQVNYVERLSNVVISKDILCHSFPNANLQEFYLSFNYWRQKFPIKALVIPLFMDDLREEGIRNVFFEKLISDRYQMPSNNEIDLAINYDLKKYWVSDQKTNTDGKSDMAALEETFQEKTEIKLNDFLSKHSEAWNNRPNVRGDFFNFLYKARNTVLGINANSTRKMIPQAYQLNIKALEQILNNCKKNDIKVLFYIPPIRSDVEIPYDKNEYKSFKKYVFGLQDKMPELVIVRNFEKIVPGNLWGYKEATNLISKREIDFMHFQYKGHEILADSLKSIISQFEAL